jgi:hypothetical protein
MVDQAIDKLTDAQRRYLTALEPNRVDEEWQGQFRNRTHRKELRRPGLDTAWPLIRKGIVSRTPEPCECGYHYASLTPLGLKVQAALRTHAASMREGK